MIAEMEAVETGDDLEVIVDIDIGRDLIQSRFKFKIDTKRDLAHLLGARNIVIGRGVHHQSHRQVGQTERMINPQ